jgi:hypothetical protein
LYTAELSTASQTGQGYVNGRPAGDVEEVLSGKSLPFAETLNPPNYLISHGLHGPTRLPIKKNYDAFS